MGHSSVRTLQRYVTNTFEHHKNAVDNLERNLQAVIGTVEQVRIKRDEEKIAKKAVEMMK